MSVARSCLFPRTAVACLTLALATVLVGCGVNDGLDKRYPISGKVLVKGEPLAKGTINFIPEDAENGRGATGQIVDGSYRSVTTLTSDDGILPGKYRVTISAIEDIDRSSIPTEADPTGMDQVAIAQAQAQAKHLVNPRYADPSSSGLSAEIAPSQRQYDFSLTD